MPKVLQIKAEPLAVDAYRPFGQVIGMAAFLVLSWWAGICVPRFLDGIC